MTADRKDIFRIGSDSDLDRPVRAFRTLLVAAQQLRYLMDERLRADGLTTQQAALITAVTALGRPSLSEAAAVLGTTHQNVAQLVASLERKGFMRVEPDPADRRRRRLITTAASNAYWRRRDDADHAAVGEWFSALSEDEVRMLCDLLTRLIEGTGKR